MPVKRVIRDETFTGPPTSLSFILVFQTDPGIKTLVVVLASESEGPSSSGCRKPQHRHSIREELYLW